MQGEWWKSFFRGRGLTSEAGFGAPRRLCDGQLLMRCLRACQGDVHVAHHWKSLAGVLQLPMDAQEVQDRQETSDGAGTMQEVQGCFEGDDRRR